MQNIFLEKQKLTVKIPYIRTYMCTIVQSRPVASSSGQEVGVANLELGVAK